MIELENLRKRRNELAGQLLEKRNADGFWEGRLSSSALGVAVAITALYFDDKVKHRDAMERGVKWLVTNRNSDGGYGDSPDSLSNISTSLLVYAAFHVQDDTIAGLPEARESLTTYLNSQGIDVHSTAVAEAILKHYKTDYTFSVPILVMCALCGIPSEDAFRRIPRLPFELALLPRSLYRVLRLSVVSYAIPALIAVGIAIFHYKQNRNPLSAWFRRKATAPSLRLLQTLMPESGGFLEAIPLTAFVGMCLIASGHRTLEVVEKGIGFLLRTQRNDGSWPIDIDLSNWVTSLSVKSLARIDHGDWTSSAREKITAHLLNQQYQNIHPFNGSKPGGWGWTNHSGSVPDGDDTPGAMIALVILNRHQPGKVRDAVLAGCDWLLNLRNRDGGFPTFVRGWGKLPFDQSCADLTGHAVLALATALKVYGSSISPDKAGKYLGAIREGVGYLRKHQRSDGALLPLWFGNQLVKGHLNPVYGTARVLTYLHDMLILDALPKDLISGITAIIDKGREYLKGAQNPDGSWGGDAGVDGTMEETALALGALAMHGNEKACADALMWLDMKYKTTGMKSSPVGLYFASLWYDEELYPYTAYLEGISRVIEENETFQVPYY